MSTERGSLPGGAEGERSLPGSESSRRATASTRSDSWLMRSASARIAVRPSSSSGVMPLADCCATQRGMSTSALPFVWAISLPASSSATTVMRLRSLSNGISCTTWCEGAIDSLGSPPFAASVSSAPSVGSPTTRHDPSFFSRWAVFASAMVASRLRSASEEAASTTLPSRSRMSPFGSYPVPVTV